MAPAASISWLPVVTVLALISIFLAAWAAFAQRDIKRVIAYSSISHLGMATVGVLVATGIDGAGLKGAVIIMIAHGLSTAGLFLCAGLVHRHARTRELASYGGLWTQAPVLGGFLLFFSVASLGLPGTVNFVGEIYVIAESFRQNPPLGILLAVAVVFAAAYSLRLFILTMHGPASGRVKGLPDVGTVDASVLAALAAIILILGFAPVAITPTKRSLATVVSEQLLVISPSGEFIPVTPVQTESRPATTRRNPSTTPSPMTNPEATQ
jgi:NADH-quinone oxidoreductase subunit M